MLPEIWLEKEEPENSGTRKFGFGSGFTRITRFEELADELIAGRRRSEAQAEGGGGRRCGTMLCVVEVLTFEEAGVAGALHGGERRRGEGTSHLELGGLHGCTCTLGRSVAGGGAVGTGALPVAPGGGRWRGASWASLRGVGAAAGHWGRGRRVVCVRCGGRGLGVGALGLVAWWAGVVAVVGWWSVGLGCLQK